MQSYFNNTQNVLLKTLPWFLLCTLFLSAAIIDNQKLVTNIFRVVVCIPIFFMLKIDDVKIFVGNRFFQLLIVLFIYTAISLFWSQSDKTVNILGRLLTTVILVYLIFLVYQYRPDNFQKFGELYLLAGLISIIAILTHWDGIQSLDRWSISYGVFNHHAPLAWYMATCALIALHASIQSDQNRQLKALLFFGFFVMVLLSQSRGGLVVLLFGIFFILFFCGCKKKYFSIRFLSGCMLTVVATVLILHFVDSDYFKDLLERADAGRFYIYENAYNKITSNWFVFFFGHGAASLSDNMIGRFQADHYHNLYLNTWYFTGLLGLLLTLILLLWNFFILPIKGRIWSVWDAIVAAMLIGFLFDGSRIYGYPSAMMFCFIIPLVLSVLNQDKTLLSIEQ